MFADTAVLNAIKIFTPAAVSFFIGVGITPFLTNYLYKHKMWKKKVRTTTTDGREAKVFKKLHKDKEVGTPKMGGLIIWASAFITLVLLWLLSILLDADIAEKLNFLSRNQTWLPLFTLIAGALVGLLDDYLEVSETGKYMGGGMSLLIRILIVFAISLVGAWWFFFKLGMNSIYIPFVGDLFIGILFIPLFIAVTLLLYSGGVIDGLDGLAGGVFSAIFAAYGIIAFVQNQIDLAAFCFVIVGSLLAFLWFNIPPARFYMSETGTMALTTTLAVIAFLTEQVVMLLIIAFPLIATTFSDVIQLTSKRLRAGKKIFHIAPIHHHFEALGWPSYKVVMRYWVLSVVFSFLGVIIALVG